MTKTSILLIFALSLLFKAHPGAFASPTTSDVVINELDYDQIGTDNAEFIEIMNNGAAAINLDAYALVLVNGGVVVPFIYHTIDLPNVDLPSGGYYVVCGNAAFVPNCDLDVSPDSNLVQNGAPDAVGLTLNNVLIDSLSYAGNTGAPYTEGSGVGLVDDPAFASRGLSRCPNGTDTDQNNLDFRFRPITPGVANSCGEPGPFGTCGDTATPVHTIQGSGTSSPEIGNALIVEGVVTGDFQSTTDGLGGYFLQEEDAQADADPLTSEGVFIYDNGLGVDVTPGDLVRVQGEVDEYNGLTELKNILQVQVCSTGNSVAPAQLNLPVASLGDWERWEGMRVTLPQTLYVSDNYSLGRYGKVVLAVNGALQQPTDVVSPGAAAVALQDLNDRSRIQLDDGSNRQNPLPLPPYLGPDNTLRLGDQVTGLAGVLSQRNLDSAGGYTLQPTSPVAVLRLNSRPTPPELSGPLRVASFNLENYFTTIDIGGFICGPSGGLECRGADSASELSRQRQKLIAAILGLDPDILGAVEVENNPSASLQDLVEGLNAASGAGTYAFVNTGTIGTDAIKVGLIYKPAKVTPSGAFAVLTSAVNPLFDDTKNRPSLAQTFVTGGGEKLTVVVSHLKSKGSACTGDPDTGDGQGNCNLTRTHAAQALASWLAGDPTASGDPDFLLIGDFNAYSMEDPLVALTNAGYANLSGQSLAPGAISYAFDGQSGRLDHAFASPSLASQVLGLGVWHIDAAEPVALDYNDYNQPLLYAPDAFRASDHDPLLVTLEPGFYTRVRLPLLLNQ